MISTNMEIPEAVYLQLQFYLESHPNWDWTRLTTSAFSLFLLQNGANNSEVNRIYLDSLFGIENQNRAPK